MVQWLERWLGNQEDLFQLRPNGFSSLVGDKVVGKNGSRHNYCSCVILRIHGNKDNSQPCHLAANQCKCEVWEYHHCCCFNHRRHRIDVVIAVITTDRKTEQGWRYLIVIFFLLLTRGDQNQVKARRGHFPESCCQVDRKKTGQAKAGNLKSKTLEDKVPGISPTPPHLKHLSIQRVY